MPAERAEGKAAVFRTAFICQEKLFEGMQTMRTLARNMTFLMKSIQLGKEKFGLPEKEPWQATNFIR
ncbi:MAG: hypothetical protein IIZ87_05245 [Selenomonas sp.]|nr:hypothetical protein [Selenomonas sp.]